MGSSPIFKSVRESDKAINPDEPIAYRRGESAAAEPAVPGWTLAVDRLFPDGAA